MYSWAPLQFLVTNLVLACSPVMRMLMPPCGDHALRTCTLNWGVQAGSPSFAEEVLHRLAWSDLQHRDRW